MKRHPVYLLNQRIKSEFFAGQPGGVMPLQAHRMRRVRKEMSDQAATQWVRSVKKPLNSANCSHYRQGITFITLVKNILI